MSDDISRRELDAAASPDAGEAHGEIHMPPNSWAPIVVALALAIVFVGLLREVRDAVGPAMWVVGLLILIAGLASWARSAVREFRELPEESHH